MPKKKGAKKGAKIIDGVATNEMSREQLAAHIKRVNMELEREREERNFFMLEREKLFSLWNMTLEQLTVEKDRGRLMEVQVADNEKEKEEEMNIHKQKLRYLMMEQSKKLSTIRLQHLERIRKLQDDSRSIEKTMQETLYGKKKELQKAKLSIHEIIRELQSKHCEDVSKIKDDCGHEIRRLESDFNRRLFIHQGNVKVDNVLGNLNLQKIEETEDILAIHENQLTDMKKFYNDMTTNNFAIISTLQNDVEDLKANENRLLMEIKKLKDELSKQKEKDDKILKSNFENLEQDENGSGDKLTSKPSKNYHKELQGAKQRISTMEKILERHQRYSKMLENSNEVLLQRLLGAEKQRDSIQETFTRALIEIQKKSSMSKLIQDLKSSGLRREKAEKNGMREERHQSYFDNFMETHNHKEQSRRKSIIKETIPHDIIEIPEHDILNNSSVPRVKMDMPENEEYLQAHSSSGVVEELVIDGSITTDTSET